MISTAGYFLQAAVHRFFPPLACVEIMAMCDEGDHSPIQPAVVWGWKSIPFTPPCHWPPSALPCWARWCSVFWSPHAVPSGGCCGCPPVIIFLPSPWVVRCWPDKLIATLLRGFCLLMWCCHWGLAGLWPVDMLIVMCSESHEDKECSCLILGKRDVETSALGSHQEQSRKRVEKGGTWILLIDKRWRWCDALSSQSPGRGPCSVHNTWCTHCWNHRCSVLFQEKRNMWVSTKCALC